MGIEVETAVKIAAYTGGGIAMGLGAVGAAIGEGYTAARANLAVSRNPCLLYTSDAADDPTLV